MEKWLLDLDEIFNRWMYPFVNGPDKSNLNREGRIINDKLGDALRDNQRVLIGHYCVELETYARSNHNSQEIAEALAICARVKTTFGELDQAENWLREARSRVAPDDHCKAVVSMMMGSLLWRLPCRQEEAIGDWALCEKGFTELMKSVLIEEDRVDWYRQQIAKINELITWASHVLSRRSTHWKNLYRRRYVQHQSLIRHPNVKKPAPAPGATPGAAPGQSPSGTGTASHAAPTPPPATGGVAAPLTWEDFLYIYKISESVPAGGFRETGGDPHPIGEVDVPIVMIHDEFYHVKNLRHAGGHRINVANLNRLEVVRVDGDSLNNHPKNDPIKKGDYVLIDPQLQEQNGNVVLVSKQSTTKPEQTLKIYHEELDRIVLLSDSEDASIPREFYSATREDLASGNVSLGICGVAVAHFSRSSKQSPEGAQ